MVRETRHLWVGNLPHTIREERILDHFKRYGKVQSVKILPKKEEDSGGACATVAFIDIKSAAKAHNADNKIEDRTLKTDYYEPPASSTASSAIYIHERDDALVRNPTAPYSTPRTPRYGLSEERTYERPGHYYGDRESYLRRPLGMGYHDEDNYQGRAKSRDRYSRANSGTTYTEGTERNQNHFRSHNTRQHFEQQRYPVGDQYSDERDPAATTPRLSRRTNNNAATPVVASVASPTTTRSESRPRRTKRRSPSRTPSGSRSNSGSRSRSRSSSGSRSSSSSSKLRSSTSDSSGRSRSPSKSRSPAASYGSQSNAKGNRLDRPSSAIANPSSTVCYLPSAVNTSAINCTSNNNQGSTPTQGCPLDSLQNNCDKEEKRPLGICVRNLPVRSTDTSLKDGLFHEYKKHGKVTMVKVIGQGTDRYAVVCFKKPEDVDKALEVSKDKLFFGCKIEVTAHEGLDAEDNEFRPLEAELDEYHPKATRTLFIGNLEKDITTAELRKHFDQFGEIIEIDIKKQGSATSYAFIQYSDIASVVKAMRKLDGENLGANRIKLGFGKSMPTNCVWLDGIVDNVSDKFLARHFARFGVVVYTAVDREKGHALVFYESVEFAQIAVSEMRGRILQGKKLQVDFASRECQTTFFDKLEMTGQLVPGDGTRPWERRERRGPEFEVRSDDRYGRETRVGFENRPYPRYEGQPRANRGNFRGNQRTGFPGRGRGQNFSGRYEVYHDEFGERRHRYNSREDSGTEATLFDGKIERIKYTDNPDCPNRKRNKLRNSISDQESHHSQSPPRSRHQSRSTSPVSKERKSLKDRLHHRIKSPGSHNSSLVNSPCRDTVLDDLETNSEYRDSRSKSSDAKMDDLMAELSYTSPRSSSEKEGSEKMLSKSECDSFRSRSSLDAESADESGMSSDQLGQLERKKRLLASSSVKSGKDPCVSNLKSGSDKTKPKNSTSHNSIKSSKMNCLSDSTIEELKSELDTINMQYECAKEKCQNDYANSDLKYFKKRQVQIMHLLEQLQEGVNSSDDCSIDGERLSHRKHRSSSICLETNSICENELKPHTKDECSSKLCKGGIKDPAILAKLKNLKTESVDDNSCVSLSLDSFICRKHLDPRKGFDQHSVALAVNSLPKCRRISVDNDSCLPNTHGNNDSFLCVPSSASAELSWKKQCSSLNDFSENETDGSITLSHFKIREDNLDDEILSKKCHLSNSHSVDLPKSLVSLRGTFSDGLSCHEIKRERDISPLSLPLPKFAASFRSPKSSPSILTSPKSTTAHSPRAGYSPSYASGKNIRISDVLHDIPSDKKLKDIVPEDKVNGANTSPTDSVLFEPPTNNDIFESLPSVEPIQSPKSNCDRNKECISSSESEFSPSSSPNRPSIEDRIKALDEKFNAWSGSNRTVSATVPDVPPSSVPELTPKCALKRSRFSYLPETRKEPSEIVKSILARPTIFDQDSMRLQHIDEKYEPLNIKMDLSPKVKPTFRTKAAAKEFSTPIAPAIQSFGQSLLVKSPATVMVAQGIMSPPSTPQSATSSIVSPVTPVPQYTQLPPNLFTPCSPRSTSFNLSSSIIKTETVNSIDKDIGDQILKSPQIFNSVKAKADPNYHANSAALATSLKSSPLICPAETPSHGSIVTSLPIKKEPSSPTEAVIQNVCNVEVEKIIIKKEVIETTNIPIKNETNILSATKDHSHFNSIDQDKKEFCDSKDPRLAFTEEGGQWRENVCKEDIKACADSSAKSYSCSDISESASLPATKKRVSSIDSNESDSSKSLKSLESSRDSQEINWIKQEKMSEPEPKRPKLSKSVRERSSSPPVHQLSKKSEKKEKSSKSDKPKSTSKSTSVNNPEKARHETKSSKSDYKEKSKEHKSSKEEKRSKSRDSKESSSKNEARGKPQERRNSEKDNKNSNSSNPSSSSKQKKDTNNKTEKSNSDKKQSDKKSTKSSKSNSNKFDFAAFMEDEPVYFSMYDKVKARSSKSQTLKHQTTSDLESVRKKFSKLKKSRAKRDEKSKSIDQDSDKDSDSSHHSSESDSEAKPSKSKQQRKRKLVIESSSDDDVQSQEVNTQSVKLEKDLQSDSATDSDFDYNVSHRQANNKTRRKKTELLESDSSDSDSNFPSKSQQSAKKKSSTSRSKGRPEKSKKFIKSEDDISDIESQKAQKSKEKERHKKIKKEKDVKVELDAMECDMPKRFSEDSKTSKKKSSKEIKVERDLSPVQKKIKSDHSSKEKVVASKEKKVDTINEKVQSSEETEKHRPYSKKRKKSKKMCRNKDKRPSEKGSLDTSRKQIEENDTKSSLPVLLSPKPSSPLPDKQLSPPCLQAGVISDNDYKSDFSDFDYENQQAEDTSRDMWKHIDTKSDTNSEKSSKNKKKENASKPEPTAIHSPEQDSSLPSFFDKLSDITDSETGREASDFIHDITSDTPKQISFSVKKDKDFVSASPHKNKHEKHDEQNSSKHDSVKYCDNYASSSKEERRRKKSKKQYKERKKKMKEELHTSKDEIIDSSYASSPKVSLFMSTGGDEDSRISDTRLDEDIAKEARRLEQELLATSEETSTFGDDGPSKREEKVLERRFEEEAAKETRRLEAELLSTGRDSWHMKEKEYDSEANSAELCDEKHISEIDSLMGKEDNIFAGLELHSSVAESSQNDADVFLSGHSEADPYKIDDKDVINEIEDQRKIEDDLAVSALLQEMHCGEISAPELTKEADYLDMEAHPEDTMNYLLPDDGENSLHIADSSPDNQGNENQEGKLESDVLSPSSNSEPPPALEISNVEDSILLKFENENQLSENLKTETIVDRQITEHKVAYEYHEESPLELCESKPPIIDLPNIQKKEQLDVPVSPKSELASIQKKKQNDKSFRIPNKPDILHHNEDTDDECSSDLTENQLTHFEDITNDTADSKDDDNPPILLPVESPPNLLPVSNSKEQMEPLDKVTIEDNHCLDRIIGKTPSTEENIFEKVADFDKQIGDIINSITEKNNKKSEENDNFQLPVSHAMSNLSSHNITDPLGLNSGSSRFDRPKIEEATHSNDFNPEEIVKPTEKLVSNSNPTDASVNFSDDSKNKIQNPNSCILETPILNYSEILSTHCETSVIQSAQKMDSEAVTISIKEKSDLTNIEQFNENHNVSDPKHASSDSFLIELFGPKNQEKFNIEPLSDNMPPSDKSKSAEPEHNPKPKTKMPENDWSTIDFGLQHEIIKPLFEIPEVNEQNEATEFNQEIFERPSDTNKDSQVPRLLSFSSEHLFSDNSSVKKEEKHTETSAKEEVVENVREEKKVDIIPKVEAHGPNYLTPQSDHDKKVEILTRFSKKDVKEEENLNIEESLENKIRPVDAESVCSDTTDITIPETKAESENNQVASSEEQVQEDVCPVEEIEINVKPKNERPRRGRRPKTRRYAETVAQKEKRLPENHNPPVNMRITRRGASGRPTSSERTRRSLRSDTSEAVLLRDLNDDKHTSAESAQPETEDNKKDDDIIELPINETSELENSRSEVEFKPSVKCEEPRRRRGRRKKNSSDHTNDKVERKSDDHEQSKDFNRPKESRWSFSLSDREQKPTKENTNNLDVYEFIESSEDEATRFESVKGLHENCRTSASTSESKHDSKASDPIVEKKEKIADESKSKIFSNDDRESISKEHVSRETVAKEHFTATKEHSSKETSKEHNTTTEENPKREKISLLIRINKGGNDPSAEIIKTSEAIINEDSKSKPVKTERDTSSKHDNIPEVPHNGPCTRKSTRLMNQASNANPASNVDKVKDEVVKGRSKSSSNNTASSHTEPVSTRPTTRRSRSSRRSEESLPPPSESSEDVTEDKNKNEPVFFILDNAVKDVPLETKKNTSSQVLEMSRSTDISAASELDKNNTNKCSLRNYRLYRNKQDSNKDTSHISVIAGEHDIYRKDSTSHSSAEDKFDALQKDHKETKEKESVKETKSSVSDSSVIPPSLPVLKVELTKVNVPEDIYSKPEKVKENEEDNNSRSSLIDPITGIIPSNPSTSESFPGTPNSSCSNDKNSNLVSDVPSTTASIRNVKPPVSETQTISTVIQESPKVTQSSDNPVVGRSLNLRSRSIPGSVPTPVTVQSNAANVLSDSTTKPNSEKILEPPKMPAKKTVCNAIPVLTITNPAVSNTPVSHADTESVTVTSSLNTPISESQPLVGTCIATSVTSTVTQSSNVAQEKKEKVPVPVSVVPKITLAYEYQVPRAIETAVVIPTPTPTPELSVGYSTAGIPHTSAPEHISTITCKPVSLPAPIPSEQPNIPVTKEVHVFPTSANPVVSLGEVTTWASTKVTSSRITEAHAHVNTIQTNTINHPVFATKSDNRSKVSIPKCTSAFTQQSGFPLTYEASRLSSAHNLTAVSNTPNSMIAEILKNQQHKELLQNLQHKEYLTVGGQVVRAGTPVASSIPPEIAARLGNPTSPHTPTPPVSSANPSDIHSSHAKSLHLRHSTQSPLMVPPHSSISIRHPTELPFVQLFANPHALANAHYANTFTQVHPDIRAQVMSVNQRYPYPMPPNSYGPSVMDPKAEQKVINDLSKIVHEARVSDEKSLHSLKSGRSKKEDKDHKVILSERDDHESHHIPVHEKIPSTSAITPHSLRHVSHYSSAIRQVSLRPPERMTDSPIGANPYVAQSRGSQIPVPGQVDDHSKAEGLYISSHLYKNDSVESKKPPNAHQTQPTPIPPPYHSLGVLQMGSSAAGHADVRSSNPAHSPSSNFYKKDPSHSQQISLLSPVPDKRVNSEHSKKVVHARALSHQGSSISPGPAGMERHAAPAHSPVSWHIQSHSSIAQSSHVILPTNEPSSRRVNSHLTPQIGNDVLVHVPPPAHAMSQPSNVPRTLPQTPSNPVPPHNILSLYPVMWQGLLALKNEHAAVEMRFVAGNPVVARASLPPIVDGEPSTVRISQRMRLDQIQLEGVYRKIQLMEEHCILMALPCGKDQNDVFQQSNNLREGFIEYLTKKNAAGIVNAAAPGCSQPAFVIHIFPSCPFTNNNLDRIAPSLLHIVNDISHLVIIIATV